MSCFCGKYLPIYNYEGASKGRPLLKTIIKFVIEAFILFLLETREDN